MGMIVVLTSYRCDSCEHMCGKDLEHGRVIDKAPWLFPLRQMTSMDASLASKMRKAPSWQCSKDAAEASGSVSV